MKRLIIASALGAALMAACSAAHAQTAENVPDPTPPTTQDPVDQAGPAAFDRAVSTGGGVQLTAGEEDSQVALRWSWSLPSDAAFTVTASTPLNEDAARTELGTLDGLANSTWLEAKYTGFHAFKPKNARERRLAICHSMWGRPGTPDGVDCVPETVRQYAPELAREFERLARYRVLYAGASARIGHEEFDYFDPTTLAQNTDQRTPWGAKIFISGTPFTDPVLFTAALEIQQGYVAADSHTVCPGGPPPVICVNGPIGAPVDSDKTLLSFEVRRGFALGSRALGDFDRFAVSAQATYDFEADVLGFDVPVYMFQDGKSGLTGGLRVGWRNDTDDFSLGLFIGKAFSTSGR